MANKYTLSHSSKYKGGFVMRNGRLNNSSDYNHDYYEQNKEKWKGAHGRPQTAPTTSGTVYKRLFSTEGEYEVISVENDGETVAGGYFLDVDPGQPQYYINWNNPDSPFYNYQKYTDEAYGGSSNAAKSDFMRGPYDKGKVYYSSKEDRYYVITSNQDALRQLSKTDDVYNVGEGRHVGLYSYKNRSSADLQNDQFMREQAKKKLTSRAQQKVLNNLPEDLRKKIKQHMGPNFNVSHSGFDDSAYLQHARKNKSPYGGGFNKGKNTSEYNRNYYNANKDRWKKNKSRRETDYFYKMRTDAEKVIDDFKDVFMYEVNFFKDFFNPIKRFVKFFYDNPVIKEAERGLKEDVDKKAIKESLNDAGKAFNEAKEAFFKTFNIKR